MSALLVTYCLGTKKYVFSDSFLGESYIKKHPMEALTAAVSVVGIATLSGLTALFGVPTVLFPIPLYAIAMGLEAWKEWNRQAQAGSPFSTREKIVSIAFATVLGASVGGCTSFMLELLLHI